MARPRARPRPALALALALGALAAAPRAARGQEGEGAARRVEGSLHVYADDDRVTVVSPAAAATVPLTPRLALDVATTVDVVSAASVDVLTSASPVPFRDTRLEASAVLGWTPAGALTLYGGPTVAHEADYDSLQLNLGGRREVARRNGIVDLRGTAARDRVGRKGDPTFARAKGAYTLAATYTQVLGRRTYADLVVEGQLTTGYQASPYRTVPLVDADSPLVRLVDEEVPDRRAGGLGLVRLRQALGDRTRWFLHAHYRFYADDWSVTSHTAGAQALLPVPRRRLTLGAELRGYRQSRADFYRAVYLVSPGEVPPLRTRDRALGGMTSLLAALTGELGLGDGDGGGAGEGPRLLLSVGALALWFDDYPPQERRTALLVTVGAAAPF